MSLSDAKAAELAQSVGNAFHQQPRRNSRPGECRCLRCGRKWLSPDRLSRRICDPCTYGVSAPLGRIYADPPRGGNR